MINQRNAFILGYTVPIVGIHFNATELLAEAGRGATGELAKRVTQQVDSFAARQRGVIDNVRRVLGLLKEAELDAGNPPKMPADYYEWEQRIGVAFEARYKVAAPLIASARLFGHAVGSSVLTLNVGVIAEYLRDAAPAHPWLLEQTAALGVDQGKTSKMLERTSQSLLLPEAARAPLSAIVAAFEAAPKIGAGDASANIQGLQAAMRAMTERVGEVEVAFSDAVAAD